MVTTCNTVFTTLYEINRQQAEIARIDAMRKKRTCGNCNLFEEDADFFVFGTCKLDGLEKGKGTVCGSWIQKNGT